MTIMNPIDATRNHCQHLSWKHLADKTEYHLELIQPLKGIVQPHSKEGAYWTIAAEVLEDSPANVLSLRKGELIVIDLTVKTFQRAWVAISFMFRKDFHKEHNLRIKFIKKTKQNMFISDVEKLVPSKDHLTFSDSIYSNPEIYAPEKKRKPTTLRRPEYL